MIDGCVRGFRRRETRATVQFARGAAGDASPCKPGDVKPVALLVAAIALTGCAAGGGTTEPLAATTRSSTPAATPAVAPAAPPTVGGVASLAPSPLTPAWTVGASPLPLRPDGFGQVLPTPTVLRNRRLPTTDLLPPPVAGRFVSSIGPVTAAIRTRMGQTWSPSCPVRLPSLRYVTVVFRGFDNKAHRGDLVVAAKVAPQVVGVFKALYANGFPIEEMRLPTTTDLLAKPTGDGNNTAGYVCRAARGQTRFSAHAYGVAIDVNPFQNPEVKRDLVLPELASAYRDRSWHRPGMFLAGDRGVRAFASIGWKWGGYWRSSKDPMHFSLTGT